MSTMWTTVTAVLGLSLVSQATAGPLLPATAGLTFTPVTLGDKDYTLDTHTLFSKMFFFVKTENQLRQDLYWDKEEVDDAFTASDTDGDGVLDSSELASSTLKHLIQPGDTNRDGQLTQAEVDAAFHTLDLDGDGKDYAGEVYAYLKQHGAL